MIIIILIINLVIMVPYSVLDGRYAELDRSMREHEASAQRVKTACGEKEETLVQQSRQLESKLEDAQIQVRQLQWANNDLKKDHEMQVEKWVLDIVTAFFLNCCSCTPDSLAI